MLLWCKIAKQKESVLFHFGLLLLTQAGESSNLPLVLPKSVLSRVIYVGGLDGGLVFTIR